jgi:hypothetical protein
MISSSNEYPLCSLSAMAFRGPDARRARTDVIYGRFG